MRMAMGTSISLRQPDVNTDNAAPCMEAGAYGVAVMGGVMGADDPEAAVAALLEALKCAQTTR